MHSLSLIHISIPTNIKIAISAGIGLFLAFLGLQSAGIIVNDDVVLVDLVDFSKVGDPAVNAAILSIIGLFIISILYTRKIKGSILIGIVATTIIGIPMGVTQIPTSLSFNFGAQAADFVDVSLFSCFEGIAHLFAGRGVMESIFMVVMLVISFSLVDMFDTCLLYTSLLTRRSAAPG